VLSRFAAAYHIGYPLLSDKGSKVIREFGILNTNVPADVMFYGIPFPGQYLLDPKGVVKDKLFLKDYRERPTASEVLLRDYGAAGNAAVVNTGDVTAKIAVSGAQSFGGHRLGVSVDFQIAPGWHVYGAPLPPQYTSARVTFDDELVARQSLEFPAPTPIKFEALGETLPAYEGKLVAVGDIVLKQTLKPGSYQLRGTIEFQECSDSVCKIPQKLRFELPLKIQPMTPAAPKA
jgi:DsbC/DsbD-like thiol-disulfide interchange protein